MKATLFSLFLATALTSCTWFESLKPKETFYCKVNGEKFRPRKDDSPIGGIGSDPIRKYFNQKDSIYSIYVDSENQFIGLNLKIKSLNKINEGRYNLNTDIYNNNAILDPNRDEYPSQTIYSEEGYVIVSKSDGFKITGTFQFKGKSRKTGKVYIISNGQFNNL